MCSMKHRKQNGFIHFRSSNCGVVSEIDLWLLWGSQYIVTTPDRHLIQNFVNSVCLCAYPQTACLALPYCSDSGYCCCAAVNPVWSEGWDCAPHQRDSVPGVRQAVSLQRRNGWPSGGWVCVSECVCVCVSVCVCEWVSGWVGGWENDWLSEWLMWHPVICYCFCSGWQGFYVIYCGTECLM